MLCVVLTTLLLGACSPSSTANVQAPDQRVAAVGSSTDTPSRRRQAACVIKSAEGVQLDGPCLFESEKNGSFTLEPTRDDHLVPNVMSVSLTVTAPGQGHVRGLTTDGINSMWGEVKRSPSDPSCWAASDFEICVR